MNSKTAFILITSILLFRVSAQTPGTWGNTNFLPSWNGYYGSPPLSDPVLVTMGSGKVLAIGGIDQVFDPVTFFSNSWSSPAASVFDPASETWSIANNMATPRKFHAASVFAAGTKVLVSGGINEDEFTNEQLTSVEIFDVTTGTWSTASSLTATYADHTSTTLSDTKVLITGAVIQGDVYDSTTNTWTPTGSMQVYRIGHTVVRLEDGRALAVGGYSFGTTHASAEIYDPSTNSWAATGSMSSQRYDHGAVLLLNGKVLVVGGDTGSASTETCEIFDPSTGQWSSTGSLSEARALPVVELLADGRVLASSGRSGFNSLNTSEIYDPATGQWSSTGNIGMYPFSPFYLLPTTRLQDGRILAANSYSAKIYYPETVTMTPYQQAAFAASLADDDALPNAIPYHDGVPNLLKFAFGLNLAGPDARRMTPGGSVGLPTAYLHENGGTVFRVEYLLRENSGLTYTPKKSTSLTGGPFAPLTGTPIVDDVTGFPGWKRVIIDEPYDPVTTPKLFTVVEVVGE